MKIIGVTGTNRAGKGLFSNFVVEKYGYHHFSANEFITDWLKTVGRQANSRQDLIDGGNDLRSTYSPDVIIRSLFTLAEYKRVDAIIESVRNPQEAAFIKSQPDGLLVALDADLVKRYERGRKDGSIKDGVTIEGFIKLEEQEMTSVEAGKQNLRKCIEMADVVFMNNETPEDLYRQVEGYMTSLETGGRERRY